MIITDLDALMAQGELAEPVAAHQALGCGGLDVETGQRLQSTERVEPRPAPRLLRLADVRRVM